MNEEQLKQFHDKFCFKDHVIGSRGDDEYVMTLHTNRDQTQEILEFIDSIEHTAEIRGMQRVVDEVIGDNENTYTVNTGAVQTVSMDKVARNKLRYEQRQKAQQLIEEVV